MKRTDPYQFHRIALAPLLPGATEEVIDDALSLAASLNEETFLNFLMQQGLTSMFDKVLKNRNPASNLSAHFRDSLRQARLHNTCAYLLANSQLTLIKDTLADAGIPHVVYKGADIRERYYSDPSLRPAVDIDVLVPCDQKFSAISAFKKAGFRFYGKEKNISHEASLIKGKTAIDLHWDILRPGRTRIPMTDILLKTRQDFGSHWGMSNAANLFVMLVHPVFVRYSTTPGAQLIRMYDLVQILAAKPWEIGRVVELLDVAGLKTAAWITLQQLKLLTNTTLGDGIIKAVKPGAARQNYLSIWLKKNIATRLLDKPRLIQLGFTLPAHDQMSDAFRVLRYIKETGKTASLELQTIEQAIV